MDILSFLFNQLAIYPEREGKHYSISMRGGSARFAKQMIALSANPYLYDPKHSFILNNIA